MKKIPPIGLGTWNLRGEECTSTVRKALELGYRHIDTAFNYENQADVGKGIRGIARDEIFVTSKIRLDQGEIDEVCDISLRDLKTDYLDLYLIHWPDRSQPIEKVLEKMERLVQEGKIRAYGVSNFTIGHLKDYLDQGAHIACNQVEFHPYLYQKELLSFCRKNNIELEAYRPLGKGALLTDPKVCEIAQKHHRTPSQILLRFLFQQEIPVVAKASSEKHLIENLMLDFTLSGHDMQDLEGLHRNQRFCNTSWADFDYQR